MLKGANEKEGFGMDSIITSRTIHVSIGYRHLKHKKEFQAQDVQMVLRFIMWSQWLREIPTVCVRVCARQRTPLQHR